jgi:hypothetical protein
VIALNIDAVKIGVEAETYFCEMGISSETLLQRYG